MIPLLASIRIRRKGRSAFPLLIPLFLVWLLLLPLILLLLPLVVAVCALKRVNPFRVLSGSWQVLAAVRGTHIEVANCRSTVSIRIL